MRANPDHARTLIGIDTHSDRHAAAVTTWNDLAAGQSWRTIPVVDVRNTRPSFDELTAAIAAHGHEPQHCVAAIDRAGPYADPLARHLRRAGINLTWIDPHQAKADRTRWRANGKTDHQDARLFAFATYERIAQNERVLIDATDPDLDDRAAEIRALLSLHHQADREVTRNSNRLRQLCLRAWPEVESSYYGWWTHVAHRVPNAAALAHTADSLPPGTRRRLAALATETIGDQSDHIADAIRLTAAILATARAREREISSRLTAALANHPYTPILTSFPAIADGHAAAIIATITDAHRVEGPKQFRALCGYGSWRRQSGNTDTDDKRQTKPRAKPALFLAVLLGLRNTPDSPYSRLYRRRRSRGRHHFQAAFAAAGLLAEHIWHCLTRNQPYRAPQPAAEETHP